MLMTATMDCTRPKSPDQSSIVDPASGVTNRLSAHGSTKYTKAIATPTPRLFLIAVRVEKSKVVEHDFHFSK